MGVAKNCGKTTTLNGLLARRRRLQLEPPALLSIGVDGEDRDLFLKTSKPSIEVVAGQWVVSAQGALNRSDVRVEYVRELEGTTPLGPVFICRAMERGKVVLGGLRHRREVARAVGALEDLGVEAIWVDGAYGRVMGAHPDVSPAALVATGAIAGRDEAEVADKTAALVQRLGCAAMERHTEEATAIEALLRQGQLGVVGDQGVVAMETSSALMGLDEVAALAPRARRGVVIPGVVSEGIVEALLGMGKGRLYVSDPTVFQVDVGPWERLVGAWDPRVWRSVEVVGVSVNPTSVTGRAMSRRALFAELGARLEGMVLVDGMEVGSVVVGDGLADV